MVVDCFVELEGMLCDDGSLDTKDDVCDGSGVCMGTAIDCSGEVVSVCTSSFFVDGAGCTLVHVAVGAVCDDLFFNIYIDVCDGVGACVGIAIECIDEVTVCMLVWVLNGVDCILIYAVEGASCNDGFFSIYMDLCDVEGGCVGMFIDCSAEMVSVCMSSFLLDGTGCVLDHEDEGIECDDDAVGIRDDICDGNGICVGTVVDCSVDVEGTLCDDGSLDTKDDACDVSGACVGMMIDCSGEVLSACTLSFLLDGMGCVPSYAEVGTSCGNVGMECIIQDICDGVGGCIDNDFVVVGTSCGAVVIECSDQDICDGVGICQLNDLDTGHCYLDAVCIGTVGSLSCTCNPGFIGDGMMDGTGCTDVDECMDQIDNCYADAVCINDAGGFSCVCSFGYVGDGIMDGTGCMDVDECTE